MDNMNNDNKWASDNDVIIQKTTDADIPVESNTSRKMGIAMGIVGVVLVVAGILPMFMDSNNLQGDTTSDQLQISNSASSESVDPLVALLSGTDAPAFTPSSVAKTASNVEGTPTITNMPSASPKTSEAVDPLVALPSSSDAPIHNAASATPESTPQVLSANTPTASDPTSASSEVETILAKKNTHVGTTDTAGAAFHGSAPLKNTSVNTASASSAKNAAAETSTPASMPKTGAEENIFLMLGLSFLFAAFWYTRRRS